MLHSQNSQKLAQLSRENKTKTEKKEGIQVKLATCKHFEKKAT